MLEGAGDEGRWVEGLHVEEDRAEKVEAEKDKAVQGTYKVSCWFAQLTHSLTRSLAYSLTHYSLEAVERTGIEWRA